MKRVYFYKAYERFWHWAQTLIVFTLLITGFEIHGSFELFGYEGAVRTHNTSAWIFLVLTVFTIFWHFTTDAWKQYIPTKENLKAQINYYFSGIFKMSPHPADKTPYKKLNPLQRIVYLGLKVFIFPVMFITGFFYFFFHFPIKGIELESLETIAVLHTLGAFVIIAFLIVHLYLITTGRTVFSSLKAMITGWEDVPEHEMDPIIKDLIHETDQMVKPTNGNGKSKKKELEHLIEALAEKDPVEN